jgi:ATP-dependent Zn protease
MNAILQIILTWLPLPCELGVLVFIIKYAKKFINKSDELPEKQLKAAQEAKAVANQAVKASEETKEAVYELVEKVEASISYQKGLPHYGEESIKKN